MTNHTASGSQETSAQAILATDNVYPNQVREFLGEKAPRKLSVIGNLDLLTRSKLGLVCSSKCPGSIILKMYETAKELTGSQWVIISGFHSPVEKECLRLFLRAQHPTIVCPARAIVKMWIPKKWLAAIEGGNLLVLSSAERTSTRMSNFLAERRNQLVVALADRVLVIHASAGGKTERLAKSAIRQGREVFTVADQENLNLLEGGATEINRLLQAVKPLYHPQDVNQIG